MNRLAPVLSLLLISLLGSAAAAQSEYSVVPPTVRGKDGRDFGPLEFPAAGTETRQWACLVDADGINRRGVLRLEDRDRMIEFALLPSAAIFYRGAPAALVDIPPGTMVEVWGYSDSQWNLPRHVLRMSDDFSVSAFSGYAYRVESVDLPGRTFTATAVPDGRSSPRPYEPVHTAGGTIAAPLPSGAITFSFDGRTDWYAGDRIASAAELTVGQTVHANFIRKFYEGPPLITRCTEVWLDEASQDLATRKQLEAFTTYTRDRGFPLRVDAADDAAKRVTVTLLETGLNDVHREWQSGQTHDFAASTTTLRMWEPNGGQAGPDRMFGVRLVEKIDLPIGYGSGGAQMVFEVPLLYEAYRPGTILKLYPAGHPVPILPIEERMPKEFDTFQRPPQP